MLTNDAMDNDSDIINPSVNDTESKTSSLSAPVPSAAPMSPLELNDIRLDANHTVLTPEYLEEIKNKGVNQDIATY